MQFPQCSATSLGKYFGLPPGVRKALLLRVPQPTQLQTNVSILVVVVNFLKNDFKVCAAFTALVGGEGK